MARVLKFFASLCIICATDCSFVPDQPRPAPGLQFLSRPESPQKPTKLVIFVHGLLGNSLTWMNVSGKSWPELMQEDPAFRDYQIATYLYDSPLLGPSSTIQEISTRMLQQLEANDIFRRYREIYFIAHSMGGIVTKRFL